MTLSTKLAESGSDAITIDTSALGVSTPSGLTKGLALGATINLLNQNGAADIVSEPSLLCINNKESSIYVGQTVSIKTSTTNGTTSTEAFSREDVGLTLKVKPRISNGGKVLLNISTKIEDVTKTDGANSQPETSKKELDTTAIVNDGESVILGGYIKATEGNTIDKVPFFSDIPVLGELFKSKREIKDKINLVIIITPYIVPKSKDLTYVRNQLAQLKLLEDKYTKDAILRLEKEKLVQNSNDLEREIEKIEVDKKKRDIKDDMLDFSEDQKDYYDDKKEEESEALDDDEKLHQQRVKKMFGI
jgi:general secretion pathway protein D